MAIIPAHPDVARCCPDLDDFLARLRSCRVCRDAPQHGSPLPHAPRPIVQATASARILVAGQAPGVRVHASGRPFTDPSGVRLRSWMGLDEAAFYDESRIAIAPMGHCFPGLDARGSDLPPRRECAPLWRAPLMARLPNLVLVLAIGAYAQRWHLPPEETAGGLSLTVSRWRDIIASPRMPCIVPLPHPSWRNNAWIKARPWFEAELVPMLQIHVARSLQAG